MNEEQSRERYLGMSDTLMDTTVRLKILKSSFITFKLYNKFFSTLLNPSSVCLF